MTISKAPLAAEQPLRVTNLTLGWLLRRSALWVVILAAAITCACWLYAAASPDDTAKPLQTGLSTATRVA